MPVFSPYNTAPVKSVIQNEVIEQTIFIIRGQRVMLSLHLANLYGIQTKVLVQSVKRNRERFPRDFMFQLSASEYKNLKSQFVTSSWGGIRRAYPYAFTEQGVAMLSSVLNSKKAIEVNISIMRTFVRLRRILASNKLLAKKFSKLEQRVSNQDEHIQTIFDAIRQLMLPQEKSISKIGFRPN